MAVRVLDHCAGAAAEPEAATLSGATTPGAPGGTPVREEVVHDGRSLRHGDTVAVLLLFVAGMRLVVCSQHLLAVTLLHVAVTPLYVHLSEVQPVQVVETVRAAWHTSHSLCPS